MHTENKYVNWECDGEDEDRGVERHLANYWDPDRRAEYCDECVCL